MDEHPNAKLTQQKRVDLLNAVDNDEKVLEEVTAILTEEDISDKSYAKIFYLLFYKNQRADKRVSYSVDEKLWFHGEKAISDMETISMFAFAVHFIRDYIEYAWLVCQEHAFFSTWINQKEYARTLATLDSMESFQRLKTSLRFAAELMPNGENTTAKVDWSAMGDPDEDMDPGEDN